MLKIDKAKWLVDSYIKGKSDEFTEEAIEEGVAGLEAQLDAYGIQDWDTREEITIMGIIVAYLYLERQINKGLDGEA